MAVRRGGVGHTFLGKAWWGTEAANYKRDVNFSCCQRRNSTEMGTDW
jgi:hypothetical protein